MVKVLVRKAVAAMEPCQTCGATAYEGCKMNAEHTGEKLSLDKCPQYARQGREGMR